jgi:hypothetical protein
VAVLQQAVFDLQGASPAYCGIAEPFMTWREDFDNFWRVLAGLEPDAVRERLDHQDAA